MSSPSIVLYDYPASICCQMVRLMLAEKGVEYEKRNVDIMRRAEQFEPWYTALNPKAVVPTLAIGEEIVVDTMAICPRIDQLDGATLTPSNPEERIAMETTMRDLMSLHYGVLLYSRRSSAHVIDRGHFLRREREKHPNRAAALDPRIAGNDRMQAMLADPSEVARHVEEARAVVGRLDAALAHRDFVSAAHWTIADAFATAALARFRLHGFDRWWSNGENTNVARYYARMRARKSFTQAGVIETGSEDDV
jgi:glutathione S-transferase